MFSVRIFKNVVPFLFYVFIVSSLNVFLYADGGEIAEIKGKVEILKEGEKFWYIANNGLPLELNDRLKTSKNSSCNIELDDGSLIYVAENTEASINFLEITSEKHNSQIGLWFGKLLAKVSKSKNTKMQVATPIAVCAVRGTEFAVELNDNKTAVGVFEGEVAVNNVSGGQNDEVSVKQDEETSVEKDTKPSRPVKLQEAMQRNKERMLQIRERIKALKEKLARVPPEQLAEQRKLALEKYKSIKAKKIEHKKAIENKRNELRQRKINRDK